MSRLQLLRGLFFASALLPASFASAGGLVPTDNSIPWQGSYIGVHGGAGIGTAGDMSTGGTLYGLHGGMNLQGGQFVAGIEADFDSSQVNNTTTDKSFSQSWISSGRARGGVAFGNNLIYGTGGLAVTGTNYTDTLSTDVTKFGRAYGAGFETLATPNIVLRGELLHYDFDPGNYRDSAGDKVILDTKTNLFRFGVSVKF